MIINDYLRNNGKSLENYGSAEFGINKEHALRLLSMIKNSNVEILGIELWKYENGKYNIDTLGGWFSEGKELEDDFHLAQEFIRIFVSGDDLVTLQFSS